jgi:hypothetical protein
LLKISCYPSKALALLAFARTIIVLRAIPYISY